MPDFPDGIGARALILSDSPGIFDRRTAISRVVFGLRPALRITAQKLLTGGKLFNAPRKNAEAPVVDLTAKPLLKSDPRLPHERDEKAEAAVAPPRPKNKRAYEDLASGQVDTDCRNAAAEIIK